MPGRDAYLDGMPGRDAYLDGLLEADFAAYQNRAAEQWLHKVYTQQ